MSEIAIYEKEPHPLGTRVDDLGSRVNDLAERTSKVENDVREVRTLLIDRLADQVDDRR